MHLIAVPLTQLPGVHTKAAAALQTNRLQLSNRLKRKLDDDDCLCAPVEEGLDEDNNNDNNDKDRNEDNDSGNTNDNSGWIDHLVNQPTGERGQKNQEGHLGWGKPKILKITSIMELMIGLLVISSFRTAK